MAGASCHGHAGQGQDNRTSEKSRRPHLENGGVSETGISNTSVEMHVACQKVCVVHVCLRRVFRGSTRRGTRERCLILLRCVAFLINAGCFFVRSSLDASDRSRGLYASGLWQQHAATWASDDDFRTDAIEKEHHRDPPLASTHRPSSLRAGSPIACDCRPLCDSKPEPLPPDRRNPRRSGEAIADPSCF